MLNLDMLKGFVSLKLLKEWVLDRIGERTSLDGTVIIAVCGGYLLLGGLIDLVAWGGLLYGAWTLWKAEVK